MATKGSAMRAPTAKVEPSLAWRMSLRPESEPGDRDEPGPEEPESEEPGPEEPEEPEEPPLPGASLPELEDEPPET